MIRTDCTINHGGGFEHGAGSPSGSGLGRGLDLTRLNCVKSKLKMVTELSAREGVMRKVEGGNLRDVDRGVEI